jgi:hypothetical protein
MGKTKQTKQIFMRHCNIIVCGNTPTQAIVLPHLVTWQYHAQAHGIINAALHREYSPSIVFIFSQGRKYLYHVYD